MKCVRKRKDREREKTCSGVIQYASYHIIYDKGREIKDKNILVRVQPNTSWCRKYV